MILTGHNDNKGFTLVELLVVLVITTILAVTAVPSFITYLQTNRLTTASQNLYYTLQYARSEALKRNTTVYVSFQTGSNWCYGINPGSTCSCNTANSCTLGSTTANSASQLTLSATGLVSNAVHFEPNHGAAGSSSTITFTNAQSVAMSVKVRLLGSLLLCSSQVSGYSACT
jgi:prepilin-type N-terminal cleavage/methylation domain-containing protein